MTNTHAKTNKWHSTRVWEMPARENVIFPFSTDVPRWTLTTKRALGDEFDHQFGACYERDPNVAEIWKHSGYQAIGATAVNSLVSNRPKWNWNMIYNSTQFTDLIILGMHPPKISIQTPFLNHSNWIKILPKKKGSAHAETMPGPFAVPPGALLTAWTGKTQWKTLAPRVQACNTDRTKRLLRHPKSGYGHWKILFGQI